VSTGVPLRTRWHKSWLRVGPTLVVVAAIFGVIALSCVTALYVGRHCERFLRLSSTPDGSEAVAAIPMEYALKSTEYNDVIFVGDSAPLYAIDPKCFQDLTGLKAYNLASFRPVSVNGFVIAVQAYLSRHPAPRLVVLCVSPEVPGGTDVERDFAKRFVRVYGTQIGGKNPAVNAIVQSIVNEDGYEVLIKRGVSILQDDFAYRFQSKTRNVFEEVLLGSDKETYNTFSKRLTESRGYIKPTEPHGKRNHAMNAGVHFAIRPEWDRAVQALLSLTDGVGARLAIRFAPARKDASVENFDEIVSGMRSRQQECPRISIDPTIRYYDPALCFDLWHLNAVGAEKYTRHLAEDLGSLLGKRGSKPAQISTGQLSP
jgi:hypothetical protein